jgi:hypothetical protein
MRSTGDEKEGLTTKTAGTKPAPFGPWLALLAIICGFLLLGNKLAYSPDSWALYELSRTVFGGDFYAVRHIRNFEQAGIYSSSFPPLWPVLIALTDAATGLGARSGFVLAVVSFALFALASEWCGRRLLHLRWIGLTAAALVSVLPGFGDEVLAGRTIPLQLALYASVLAVAGQGPLQARQGLPMGLLLGLAVLNRFDALPVAVLLPLAAILLQPNARFFATYTLSLATAISPWIVYSRTHFGTWFKSDNSSIALSVERRHVAEFYVRPPLTALDAPAAWLEKVAGNGLAMIGHFIGSLGILTWIALVVVLATLVWQGARTNRPIATSSVRPPAPGSMPPLRVLAFGPLLMSLTLCGYVVTGYLDGRYFTPLWWAPILVLLAFCVFRCSAGRREAAARLAAYVAILLTALFAIVLPARSLPSDQHFPSRPGDRQLQRCLKDQNAEVLMMRDHSEAARLSALYGFRTMLMPLNIAQLRPDELAILLERYRVRVVQIGDGADPPFAVPSGQMAAVAGCPSGWFKLMVNTSLVHGSNDAANERTEAGS